MTTDLAGASILLRIAERARAVRGLGADSAGALPSPCISVCRMDPASGLCQGCLRTIDEIVAWGSLDDSDRRAVWALIEQRTQVP